MKIKTIISEHCNDFIAIMVCEHCGTEWTNNTGYHDNNYHVRVIPEIFCAVCHRNRAGETRLPVTVAIVPGIAITLRETWIVADENGMAAKRETLVQQKRAEFNQES